MDTNKLTSIDKLKLDDKTALNELFNQYFNFLCNLVYRYVKDKDVTKDIAQTVFIKLWEKRKNLNIKTSEKSYLSRMAINEAISYLRKEKKHLSDELPITLQSVGNSETEIIQTESISHIHKAIASLPPRCQLIFKLSRFEELTYQEIATQLDISKKTVEHQMGKALRVLREQLLSKKKS